MTGFQDRVAFIWSVADLLRGDYKQSEYGRVILPLVVLRRLDCVLEPTKPAVLAAHQKHAGNIANLDPLLRRAAGGGHHVYNTSPLDFRRLLDDPANVRGNLERYISQFSPGVTEVIERFSFHEQIARLDRADLLYLVVAKFADIDLHPDAVSNLEMGYVFEELIRRFSEQSNETAGEHFTPREVIRLMVDLLFAEDDRSLAQTGVIKTLYDPACGTGGMLSVAEEYLRELNPDGQLEVFGQELNAESYAICRADMLLKGDDPSHIAFGNTLSGDQHEGRRFDYMLSNPPFGVEWKKIESTVRGEADQLGHAGRFGAGLPRINDGSFLFLQHMIAKMKAPKEGGSRIAIVFNGSPLFTGAAGSGESEIRRWIIESDWLDAIVALPDQLFYNTGISTYIWIVDNAKAPERRGQVQLIDARSCFRKMRRSLGEKRQEIAPDQIAEITRIYSAFEPDGEHSKVFANEAFGFRRITVERPLRLRYEVSAEAIEALRVSKAFIKLAEPAKNARDPEAALAAGERLQAAIVEGLSDLIGESSTDRAEFESALRATALGSANGKVPAPVVRAVWETCSIRDPDAPVVTDAKGRPVADPELRDQENVPLDEDVAEYMTREVLPHVPDAWVDESKTKIGYEIPLTRHFYRYVPPRPLEEIDAEIRELETEIVELLGEVTG